MKWLKKFAAGMLLVSGVTLSLALIVDIVDPETDGTGDSVAALILFGLPPIAISGLLIHSLRQQHQANEQKSDREIELLFLTEIQANNGVVNPIIFATKTDLSLDESKAYLDEKAVQLNGLYEATESGGIIYRFPI
jgi:hypothetical protein